MIYCSYKSGIEYEWLSTGEGVYRMPTISENITAELDKYAMLQRIKADSQGDNPTLDYEIKLSEAKLHSLGINTDDLKIVK